MRSGMLRHALSPSLAQLARSSLWVQSVFGPLFLDNRFESPKSRAKTFLGGKLPSHDVSKLQPDKKHAVVSK
jgi:hypothetical protein